MTFWVIQHDAMGTARAGSCQQHTAVSLLQDHGHSAASISASHILMHIKPRSENVQEWCKDIQALVAALLTILEQDLMHL